MGKSHEKGKNGFMINKLNKPTELAIEEFLKANLTQDTINKKKLSTDQIKRYVGRNKSKINWYQLAQKGVDLTIHNIRTRLENANLRPYRSLGTGKCQNSMAVPASVPIPTNAELANQIKAIEKRLDSYEAKQIGNSPYTTLSEFARELESFNKTLLEFNSTTTVSPPTVV